MEAQDGITVRSMRLKVLYTFDDENKVVCLARWPHLLNVQTAYLDEETQIGVIELKTCIQAIVSASPELVAKLGQDYTVYAYDYSEYETPLVGQGMLSWVLASTSLTPNTPAHQSRTIVTGRVCKNVLGIFTKGIQETLEVKLRLVPVPSVLQSEYLESMQKYRELSNIIPQEFDAQAWTAFIQQNPNLFTGVKRPQPAERTASPMGHSGIERFHQLLSESSTPSEFPSGNPSDSPTQSPLPLPSRSSTPTGQRQQQRQKQPPMAESDGFTRPSSRASTGLPQQRPFTLARRRSVQSGYGSGEDSVEQAPRKRAKLFRAEFPGKEDMNIERQPCSLRVAASTAASVRIHRPTPVHLARSATQTPNEEPVRPPTPISRRSSDPSRRARFPSLLCESIQDHGGYASPYPTCEGRQSTEPAATSPEEPRYQGIFEPQFTMPSSPPVLDGGFPSRSSPILPPMPTEPDSGFMSGSIEDLLDEQNSRRANGDEGGNTPSTGCQRIELNEASGEECAVNVIDDATSPVDSRRHDSVVASDQEVQSPIKEKASPLSLPASTTESRPTSRATARPQTKALAPAPMSQSEVEQLMSTTPASDPVLPPTGHLQHLHSWSGSLSDFASTDTPAPPSTEEAKVRGGAGARRVRQVQARLEQCVREGQVPPFCENCGAIETPTWRRAWSKEIEGSEQDANRFAKDPMMLFWQVLEKDSEDRVKKFKVFKKTLADADHDFVQILLCNPCGLWLHKFKHMRPENKWNKPPGHKKKRPSRKRKGLSISGAATRSRSKAQKSRPSRSSPGPTDASSSPGDDSVVPNVDNENENEDLQDSLSKRRRANSVEPRKTTDTVENRWREQDAIEALRRAIQSSPARNLESRHATMNESCLTPKSVRRVLFPGSHEGPLKALGDPLMNSPRRSPRIALQNSGENHRDKENRSPASPDNLDDLFESTTFEFDISASPTPKRPSSQARISRKNSLSLLFHSPTTRKERERIPQISPTRITAEKLQLAQEQTSDSTPPKRKCAKPFESDIPALPSLGDGSPRSIGHEIFDGIVRDIFGDQASTAQTESYHLEPPKFPGGNWEDWVPFGFVSPARPDADEINTDRREEGAGRSNLNLFGSSVHDDSDDIIKAILSDPEIQTTTLSDFLALNHDLKDSVAG